MSPAVSQRHMPHHPRAALRPDARWAHLAATSLLLGAVALSPAIAAPVDSEPAARKPEFRVALQTPDPGLGALRIEGAEAPLPLMRRGGNDDERSLLSRYRSALERESARAYDRDPGFGWVIDEDGDGAPQRRSRRQAERIFEGATNRMLSRFLEQVVEQAASLRTARGYLDGVSLDVSREGGVKVAGTGDKHDDEAATRLTLVAIGRPRVEMRSRLRDGLDARVEVSLTSPGVSGSLTHRLAPGVKGRLGLGVEDAGSDRWISAGVELRF